MRRSIFISWVKCFVFAACTLSFSLFATEKNMSDSSLFDVHVSAIKLSYSALKNKTPGYRVELALTLKDPDMQICSDGRPISFKSNLPGDIPNNNMFFNTVSPNAKALSIIVNGTVVPANKQNVILHGIVPLPVAKSTKELFFGEVSVGALNTAKTFSVQGLECTMSARPSASSANSNSTKTEGIDVTLTYPKNLNVKSFDFKVDDVSVSGQSKSTMRINQSVTKEYRIPKIGKKVQVTGIVFDEAREINVPVKVEFSAVFPEKIVNSTSKTSPFDITISSLDVMYPSPNANTSSTFGNSGYTVGITLATKDPKYFFCSSNQKNGTFKSNCSGDNTRNNSFFNEFSENGKSLSTKIDVKTTPIKNQKVCVKGTLPVVIATATKKMTPIDLPLAGMDTIMIQGVPCPVSVEKKKVTRYFGEADMDGFEVQVKYPNTLRVESFDFSVDGLTVKSLSSSTCSMGAHITKTFMLSKVGKKLQIGATIYDDVRECTEPVNFEFQIDGTAKPVRLKSK